MEGEAVHPRPERRPRQGDGIAAHLRRQLQAAQPAAVDLRGDDLRAGGRQRRAAQLDPEVARRGEEELDRRHLALAPDEGRAVLAALVVGPTARETGPRRRGAEIDRPHLGAHLGQREQGDQVDDPVQRRPPRRRAREEAQGDDRGDPPQDRHAAEGSTPPSGRTRISASRRGAPAGAIRAAEAPR
jgi:hypothetical protein